MSGPRRKTGRLRKLHTFDWEAECPVCGHSNTSEDSTCPNDGSPLVVAFGVSRWNMFDYPVGSAEFRCVKNCGFHADVVTCNHDNTIIDGDYIHFRFSRKRCLSHNLFFGFLFAFGLGLVLVGIGLGMNGGGGGLLVGLLLGSVGLATSRDVFFKGWWKFRRRFTFEDVAKASVVDEKEEARAEAVKTAKKVKYATKSWLDNNNSS